MDPMRIACVAEWFEKAGRDLSVARRLGSEAIYRDAIVFHCQQAVEKGVKGFLAYHDLPTERTHDVAGLIVKAAAVEPSLLIWKERAKALTKFAVAYRYPGMDVPLEEADVAESLHASEGIVSQILALLPDEVRPRDLLPPDPEPSSPAADEVEP